MQPADEHRFRAKVVQGPECWAWTGTVGTYGYGVFWMGGRQHRATHIALELDGRPVPPDRMACHHCDNPRCVRPSHVYIGTHEDNMRDRMVRGRTARGDRMPHQRVHGQDHPKAKLSEADVLSIRARYRPGLGGELAREYGINQASLWNIVNGRTWKHLLALA